MLHCGHSWQRCGFLQALLVFGLSVDRNPICVIQLLGLHCVVLLFFRFHWQTWPLLMSTNCLPGVVGTNVIVANCIRHSSVAQQVMASQLCGLPDLSQCASQLIGVRVWPFPPSADGECHRHQKHKSLFTPRRWHHTCPRSTMSRKAVLTCLRDVLNCRKLQLPAKATLKFRLRLRIIGCSASGCAFGELEESKLVMSRRSAAKPCTSFSHSEPRCSGILSVPPLLGSSGHPWQSRHLFVVPSHGCINM